MVPLAVGFNGKKLNSPNDLVFDNQGSAVFHRSALRPAGTHSRIPARNCHSTRCSASPRTATITRRRHRPRSAERARLLARLQDAVRRQRARQARRSGRPTRCKPDGSLDKGRVFADSSALYKEGDGVPDGLKIDVQGNVFATGPGGVLVYAPDGTLLGRILTGVPTANVAFGEDGATLFITANHRVLRLRTLTKGVPLPADQ